MLDKDQADRIKKGMAFIKQDLLDAEFFFKQNKYRDSIQKLFQVYENSLNVIKDRLNGRPLADHEEVTHQLKIYFDIGRLNKDYSENHRRLDKLRKLASFGPYTKYKPERTTVSEIKRMLEEAKELVEETRKMVK